MEREILKNKNTEKEVQNPFLGLKSYEEIHKSIFGGRNTEIKEIFDLIDKNIVTIVFGKAGIGKTSLFQAGVIPRLKEHLYLPIYFRINFRSEKSSLEQTKEIVESKIKALDKTVISFNDFTLWEYFHQVKIFEGIIKPVLIFDQFEEIFAIGKNKSSEVNEFINEIANLIENRIPLSVQEKYRKDEDVFTSACIEQNYRAVFSLREDYLPQLEGLNMYMPSVRKSRFRVMPFKGDHAVDAILKPGKGIIDEEVAIRIIQKMPQPEFVEYLPYERSKGSWEDKKIEPLLLSLFCEKLNEKRIENNENKISSALLETISIADIIESHYEDNVETEEQKKKIEELLLTNDGKRQLQEVSKLEIPNKGIETLINRKVIRRIVRNGVHYVELIHDALAPIVKKRRDERRKREEDLAAKKQLEKMIEEQKKRSRARYRIVIATASIIVAIMAIIFAFYAHSKRKIAETKTIEANDNLGLVYLKNSDIAILEKDFNSARLYSLYALKYLKKGEDSRALAKTNILSYLDYPIIFSKAYPNPIKSVNFRSDGRILAAGSEGKIVILRDANSGKKIFTFEGHLASVNRINFSPDGKILASASKDNEIRLWEINTGKEIATLKGHSGAIIDMSFSFDGKIFASISDNNEIKLWDIREGKEIISPEVDWNSLNCIRFSPKGKILALGGDITSKNEEKGIIKLWDVENSAHIVTLKGAYASVCDLNFAPNGNILASSSSEDIVFWDVKAGKRVSRVRTHSGLVSSLDFSPDGKMLVTYAEFGDSVKLWDIENECEKIKLIVKLKTENVNCVCFRPDGKAIASISKDKMNLWNLRANRSISTLEGHSNRIHSVDFSPDGKMLASAGRDKIIKIWDTEAGKEVKTLKGHSNYVGCVRFSPNGEMLASGSLDKTIKIWDIKSGKALSTFNAHPSLVCALSFSSDGKKLASGGSENLIKIWDIENREEISISETQPDNIIVSLIFSPTDDDILASGEWDESIKIWDTKKREVISTLKGHSGIVTSISFSPDGRKLASGSLDETVRLWDVKKASEIQKPMVLGFPVYTVRFSPDGEILAAGGLDSTIKIWDTKTWKKKAGLKGHLYSIHGISFSPKGRRLASGSDDNTVKLWDLSYLYDEAPIETQIQHAQEKYKLILEGVELVPEK